MGNHTAEPKCNRLEIDNDSCHNLVIILVLLFLLGIGFSLYINIKLIFIIWNFQGGLKVQAGYFPVLFIMSVLACPAEICIVVNLYFVTKMKKLEDGNIVDQINPVFFVALYIAFASTYAYPMVISFLDFLLCSHRIFSLFGIRFSPMTDKFRWFGVFLFIVFLPAIVFLSIAHKAGDYYFVVFGHAMSLQFFNVLDNILRVLFTFGSVCGYLAIIWKLIQTRKCVNSSMDRRDDVTIIKQALPIAISQMILVVLQFKYDSSPDSTDVSKMFLGAFLFVVSTIVVPVSIINGNPLKRKIYKNSRCCCQNNVISEMKSFENTAMELEITHT